jgi:hypothetical protein
MAASCAAGFHRAFQRFGLAFDAAQPRDGAALVFGGMGHGGLVKERVCVVLGVSIKQWRLENKRKTL